MFTPKQAIGFSRILLVVGAVLLTMLLLGPFQGMESYFGLTDKEAHAIAFYVVVSLAFISAPKLRRTDICLAAIALGCAAEIAQFLVGRDASILDILADIVGVAAVWAPSKIEDIRRISRDGLLHKADRRTASATSRARARRPVRAA